IRPTLADIGRIETVPGFRLPRRHDVDRPTVLAGDGERGSDPGLIYNLHQERARTVFDQFRGGCATLHVDTALRADGDYGKDILIQDGLYLGNGRACVSTGGNGLDPFLVTRAERLAK